MRQTKPAITRTFCCLLVSMAAHSALADTGVEIPTIALRETAEVSAPTITLGDIAQITAPEESTGTLGAVVIGPSPLPGLSRSITIGYIKVRLRQNALDPNRMTFGDVDEVTVVRAETGPLPAPNDISLTSADGHAHAQIVAARRIPRGHVITPTDLAPSTYPDLTQQLIGLRATRFIEAGAQVTLATVEPVPAVDRGDLVTLIIEVGIVRIKAMAEIRAPAAIGELTKVRVLQTNKLLDAQVLDSQTVRLPSPQRGSAGRPTVPMPSPLPIACAAGTRDRGRGEADSAVAVTDH